MESWQLLTVLDSGCNTMFWFNLVQYSFGTPRSSSSYPHGKQVTFTKKKKKKSPDTGHSAFLPIHDHDNCPCITRPWLQGSSAPELAQALPQLHPQVSQCYREASGSGLLPLTWTLLLSPLPSTKTASVPFQSIFSQTLADRLSFPHSSAMRESHLPQDQDGWALEGTQCFW